MRTVRKQVLVASAAELHWVSDANTEEFLKLI
jgi:hypothetical protein